MRACAGSAVRMTRARERALSTGSLCVVLLCCLVHVLWIMREIFSMGCLRALNKCSWCIAEPQGESACQSAKRGLRAEHAGRRARWLRALRLGTRPRWCHAASVKSVRAWSGAGSLASAPSPLWIHIGFVSSHAKQNEHRKRSSGKVPPQSVRRCSDSTAIHGHRSAQAR